VSEAEERLKHEEMERTAGRILASLPFGFWNGLFVRSYSTLWAQTLHRCFTPHGPGKRERIIEITDRIKLFRNRIAHHERLIHTDLHAQHKDLLKIVMWISPDARDWVAGQSQVLAVLRTRPG
jgi:hypothetical protein